MKIGDSVFKKKISRLVSESYNDADTPGCGVLINHKGNPVFMNGWGLAHLETGAPITPGTNFRIASVTKQFTAMAILILVEHKEVNLEDTLTRFFPRFPSWGGLITVRHLLEHTSGLPDYEELLPAGDAQVVDADVLEIMMEQKGGMFSPGMQYHYSNSGYALIAMIVNVITGMDLAAFAHETIFTPLGMISTLYHKEGITTVPNRAYGYKHIDGKWRYADQSRTSAVLGDGGIYTSLVDYAKWDKALYGRSLVSREIIIQAFTPGKLLGGTSTHYGFGWRIDSREGLEVINHTGSTTGFNSCVRRIPEKRLCVAVFSNRNGEEPTRLALEIESLVLASLSE